MEPPQRRHIYRSFLQHLQRIPNRHIWATAVPKFRALLESQTHASHPSGIPEAEGSRAASLRAARAQRDIKRARKELHQLQAAVSAQPHALLRLFEKAYGLRGAVRWELIRHIQSTSPSQTGDLPHRPPLPPCLVPFRPNAIPPREKPSARLYIRIKPTAARKAAVEEWTRHWTKVKVPLILPEVPDGPRTGWERSGVIEELHKRATLPPAPHLAEQGEHEVQLPSRMARIFPSSRTPRRNLPPYPTPPPSATRQNPNRWSFPRRLDARLLRNIHRRVWNQLVWSCPRSFSGEWVQCSYDQMVNYVDGARVDSRSQVAKKPKKTVESGYFEQASSEDLQWI